MAYGDLKCRNLIWNSGSGDNTVVLSTLLTSSSPNWTGTATGVNLTLSGNLTVSGTQTIINTNVLQVEDKHIEIGKVSSPSDTTADGGGIILKASSDRTFVWINSTDAWTSSEHIQVASGKTFIGDGSTLTALNATNLASGTVPTARLGSGTAGSSNFLRGDGSWQAIDTDKIEEGNTSVETIDTGSDGHVKITTEGTERVRVSNDGKVGIAIGAPEELLHIRDASAPAIQLEAWAGGPYKSLIKMGGNDMEIRGSSGSMEFYTGDADGDSSTKRFQIGASGQLGIGGATYGSSGQVLTSGGASAAPSWTTISAAPEITATASGAIAQHKAVGVNSNGTISDIKVTINVLSTPTATSSERLYDDASSWYNTVAYDPDKDVILAGWWDSWKFRVACGRMAADGSITWAPRQTAANSANVKFYSACYNADRKCFVLAYKYGTSDTSPTQIQVATVNSETLVLTWQGSPTSISNGSTYKEEDQTIVYDSSSKACIVGVRENATPYKTQAWIVNISDSYGISYSDTNGQLANNYAARPDFCMGANRNFMSSWQAETDSDKIMVSLKTLNTSGAWTSNTAVAYEVADPSGNVEWTSIAYDPNADKYIVAWSVPTDSNKLFACTLTVTGSAGSESISKGTTVEVSSGTNRHDLAFDSTINKMACRYLNDSMYLRLKYLTISGTNITVGNEVSINGNNDAHGSNDEGWTQSIVHVDTAQRMFLIHSRGQDSNYVGYSTVSGGTSTNNLSSFIGYANNAIADTASGAVAVTGNTNSGQSGLTAGTKYYVQKDGSLSTTADTPSVEAGIALSASKLLIKG